MAGSITFGGLGSGLDSGAIIDALLNLERVPINALESRKAAEKQKIDLLGTFQTNVRALRDAAQTLSTLSGFLEFQVQPSLEGFATFSAGSGAVAGSHTLIVDSLASADRWALDGVADANVDLASADGQTLDFTYDGTDYSIPVTAAQSSLNEIAAAIKTAVNGSLNVSVVNSGPTSSPNYQLVLSANQTGEDFRISGFSSTIAGLTVDGTGPDASGVAQSANNITVGSNAIAEIDGLLVERSNNDFSGVVDGVSMTLTSADPTTPITFTVDPDKEAIKAGVQEFVDAYNAIIDFVNAQNKYSEEEGPGGPLFGDSALQSVRRTITGVLFSQSLSQVQSDTDGYGTLRLLGIEADSTGRLNINDTTFDAKLDGDLSKFAELFVDSDGFDNGGAAVGTSAYYVDTTADTGLADDLMRAIDQIIKPYVDASGASFDGLFDAKNESLNANIKLFDKQIDDRQYRLDKYQDQLIARFTNLERVMATLNAQLGYLDKIN